MYSRCTSGPKGNRKRPGREWKRTRTSTNPRTQQCPSCQRKARNGWRQHCSPAVNTGDAEALRSSYAGSAVFSLIMGPNQGKPKQRTTLAEKAGRSHRLWPHDGATSAKKIDTALLETHVPARPKKRATKPEGSEAEGSEDSGPQHPTRGVRALMAAHPTYQLHKISVACGEEGPALGRARIHTLAQINGRIQMRSLLFWPLPIGMVTQSGSFTIKGSLVAPDSDLSCTTGRAECLPTPSAPKRRSHPLIETCCTTMRYRGSHTLRLRITLKASTEKLPMRNLHAGNL